MKNSDRLVSAEPKVSRTRLDKICGPIAVAENVQVTEQREYQKPKGFWYEVNGGWRDWLRSEDISWASEYRYLHDVKLGDEMVLCLRNADDIDAFTDRYRQRDPEPKDFGGSTWYDTWIDWARVGLDFDGLEIAPYVWERRLDQNPNWYYTWDVASGCIWRPKDMIVTLRSEYKYEPRVREVESADS